MRLARAACRLVLPSISPAVSVPTLIGHAVLPADSYVAGPTSGQFISGGDYTNATGNYVCTSAAPAWVKTLDTWVSWSSSAFTRTPMYPSVIRVS